MESSIRSFVPPACISLGRYFKKKWLNCSEREKLNRNKLLKNIHKGKRCFILCNGPSVNDQNLTALRNEIVISVSSGYNHNGYAEIKPKYHVVPQITFGRFTEEDAIAWFGEMDRCLLSEILFLSSQQYNLVEKSGLLTTKHIHYVGMFGDFTGDLCVPSIDKYIPGVQSVPVLAIMIAMYMGFNRIYLLGTDHDWFIKKNYLYAFGPTIFAGKDPGVERDGRMPDLRLADELPIAATIWGQYRALREIAEKNKIKIYNATAGGALDEFERVDFDGLFNR